MNSSIHFWLDTLKTQNVPITALTAIIVHVSTLSGIIPQFLPLRYVKYSHDFCMGASPPPPPLGPKQTN